MFIEVTLRKVKYQTNCMLKSKSVLCQIFRLLVRQVLHMFVLIFVTNILNTWYKLHIQYGEGEKFLDISVKQ